MVVMCYANKGNLRKYLPKIIEKNWAHKLFRLYQIITGLHEIHQQNLIHCDFHDGNILNKENLTYISDLGLCQPTTFFKKDNIYGVIPFMAPEVLRGKPYTLASDIYSFSMIMWEFTSGVTPFYDRAHDLQLCLSICKGERPEITENIPQCYINLMKKCWDEDPLKRPTALEVLNIIIKWIKPGYNIEDISEDLKNSIMEFMEADNNSTVFKTINNNDKPISKSHSQAYHTSRLLDFTKNLNEILDQEEKERLLPQSECLDCIVTDLKSLGMYKNVYLLIIIIIIIDFINLLDI